MSKKLLSLALVGVLALSAVFVGCGEKKGGDKDNAQNATKKEKTFRISVSADIPDLDPALVSDDQSSLVANQIFQGLTYIAVDGSTKEDAAEKIEHNEDYSVWNFTLRDGLTFSNGDKIDAEAFKYSWTRLLDPKTKSGQANRAYMIKGAEEFNTGKGKAEDLGIQVKDAKTLVITLAKPNAYFAEAVAYPVFSVVNKAAIEKGGEKWTQDPATYIGSGAYKLVEYALGSKITFEKNDKYWDAKNVDVDKIEASIIKENSTVYQKFKNKELDYLGAPAHSIPTDLMDEAKGLKEYKRFPTMQIYWYKVNTAKAPMDNVHLRRALAYSIDRKSIVDNIAKADQIPAMGLVPQFETPFFKDKDIDAAKKELELAMKDLGVSSPADIKFTLSYNTNEGHQKIAQAIQEMWKTNLGVQAEINNTEWKVYLTKLKEGDYQIGRLGWVADYTDPADFLNMYQFKDGDDNMTYWGSDAFNAKIKEATKFYGDKEKRNSLLKEAEAIIMNDMPVIPIYYGTRPGLVQDTVKEASPTLLGNLYVKDVKMK